MQLLQLSYDGTDFSGCDSGPRSVGAVLSTALNAMGATPPDLVSRTDSGVHARGQVAYVQTLPMEQERALQLLDRHLPADLRCLGIATTQDRPVVRQKWYRYRLDMSPRGDAMRRDAWRPPMSFEPERLHEAATLLQGEHDWRAFERTGEQRTDLTRTIDHVAWSWDGPWLCCDVRAPTFTYRLVRSMVGSMLSVAAGSASLEQLSQALDGEPNGASRQQAPARGLCLEHILFTSTPEWYR